MKLPAFQFYPGDWIRDPVSGCSLAAQGLWLRMMFLAHDSDRYGYLSHNGTPIPPEHIARRCGIPLDQYVTLLAELDAAGVPSRTPEKVIYSRRMVRDSKEREGNRKRQTRFRVRNGDVTPPVTPMSEDEVEDSGVFVPKGRGAGKGNGFVVLRKSLCQMFKRDEQEVWGYTEEYALTAVAQRKHALDELDEIKAFRLTGELFPQSIDSLLANWAKTLDRARNPPNRTAPNGASKTLVDKQLDSIRKL